MKPKPFELLITFDKASLVTGYDGAVIPDGALQNAQHCIFDYNVLETAPGRTQIGTQLEGGAQIDGIFRSWDKWGNLDLLVSVNGKIKYWTGATFSDLQTGLTASVPYDFLNDNESTYIVNGYDDAFEFKPRTNIIQKAGLEPPRFYKKVAYFETDETIDGNGYSLDTTTFRIDERTGKSSRSLKVTADAGQSKYGYTHYASAQNFSVFPNGQSITNNDYVVLWVFHRTLSYISQLSIRFQTGASGTDYYEATFDSTDLDPILQRDNQWTEVKIRKSAFATYGSPSWSSIDYTIFYVTAVTGTAVVNFDNCYIKNTPIQAISYGKMIENFNGPTGEWTTNGNLTYTSRPKFIKSGNSLKVVGTNVYLYKPVSLDLSKFQDNVASQNSDQICLWVYINDTTNLTSIVLTFYSDTTVGSEKYYQKTYTTFNASTSGGWNEIRIKKGDFTPTNGPSWASIVRIHIQINSTASVTCYFDNWTLEEFKTSKVLAKMDETGWTWSPAGCGGFCNSKLFITYSDNETPSSIYIRVPCKEIYYAQLDWATKDLTIFGSGEPSSTNDLICFWAYWDIFHSLKKITIMFDVNTFNFSTDYYYYEIDRAKIKELKAVQHPKKKDMDNISLFFEIKKSDFTRVGTTAGKDWSTTEGIRFQVQTITKAGDPIKIYFDDLHMRRSYGITGLYEWCCVFSDDNNVYSAPSEWSNLIEVAGARVSLDYLPISVDSRVTKRLFFRRGGDLGDVARLDFILYDNVTTSYFTDTQDYELTMLLSDSAIPTGTIRFPLASRWAGIYKDRAILYRDPSNLNRFYYSNIDYLYAWSELQAWDMPSEITDIWIDDDILFINTKLGIKRLSIDLGEAQSTDFEETGIVKAAVNPYASAQCEELRANVLSDGIYLFNGYTHQYISEPIYKPYFDSALYDINSIKIIYRKRHLYLSVRTVAGIRSLLDCYLPKNQWRSSDYSINCFCIFDGPTDNLEFYGGTTDGKVYQLDTSYATGLSVTTKDYAANPENTFEETLFEEIYIKAKSNSSNPGQVTVQFRIDQILNSGITLSFPSSGDLISTYKTYVSQLMGIQNYLKGSKVGLIIGQSASNKHIEIESILLRGSIPELPKAYEE